MAAVLRLMQRSSDELVTILEGALSEARAGRLHSIAGCFMSDGGNEYLVLSGAYKANRIAAAGAGLRIKAHATAYPRPE